MLDFLMYFQCLQATCTYSILMEIEGVGRVAASPTTSDVLVSEPYVIINNRK